MLVMLEEAETNALDQVGISLYHMPPGSGLRSPLDHELHGRSASADA